MCANDGKSFRALSLSLSLFIASHVGFSFAGNSAKVPSRAREEIVYGKQREFNLCAYVVPSTKLRRVFRKFSFRGKTKKSSSMWRSFQNYGQITTAKSSIIMKRHFVHADNATNFSKSQFVIMVMWGSRLGRCQDDCAVSRLHSNLIMQRCRLWSDIYWKFVFASRFCYS